MTIDHAERVQVKLYADGAAPEPAALIHVFHSWIRQDTLDGELLVDVADYSHVHEGPGVILIGHGSDVYYDQGEGRPGLLFSRKRAFEGDLRARLADSLRRALGACALLEDTADLGLRFGRQEVLVRVPDRLHAPNTDEAFDELQALMLAVLRDTFGARATVTREGSPLEPLTARVRLDAPLTTTDA